MLACGLAAALVASAFFNVGIALHGIEARSGTCGPRSPRIAARASAASTRWVIGCEDAFLGQVLGTGLGFFGEAQGASRRWCGRQKNQACCRESALVSAA